MFSSVKRFVDRHKKKIVVIGVVVGGAVLATRYAQRRFIEWQEKEAKEFLERTRKQHYFESTEKTCNQTIFSLAATLRENIMKLVNCDDIIQQLRENPPNKVELWQSLKVLVFTKVSMLIYSGTLLVIALRIQLNIISGHIFCKTQLPEVEYRLNNELEEKYLSQCHHFLNEGIKQIYPLIKEKVELTLKDVTLKQDVTLQNIEHFFWAIQAAVNNDENCPIRNMPGLLYDGNCGSNDKFIKDMMLDTIDLLQREEIRDIALSCVSRGFSSIIDRVSEFFMPEENHVARLSTSTEIDHRPKFTHPNNLSKPFAKVIPLVNTFGNPVATSNISESWISPFLYLERVRMLGANIYESYSYSDN